ncbi:hypothetical protein QZH41_013305, partial [Actinostola sp. cb2023]
MYYFGIEAIEQRREKLGWDTSKTDDVLLPVLKQLNKDE